MPHYGKKTNLANNIVNENLQQNQIATPQEPKKNTLLEELEFGLGGIFLGVGTFLLMLFALNYFNIVSLSLVFPKYFGFLPHRPLLRQ